MKTLLVNHYDTGGAGKACVRLHEALLDRKMDSNLLVLKRLTTYNKRISNFTKASVHYSLNSKLKYKIINILKELKLYSSTPKESKEQAFLKNREPALEMFSFPYSEFNLHDSPLIQNADIINLHWVANFIDYNSFFKKNTKPTIWTLHDMNPFSGGEHYEEKYIGMGEDGYPIKRKYKEEELLWISKNLEYKKRALDNFDNLHIVTLCHWMKKLAAQSDLFASRPIHIIPNSLDFSVFRPIDKEFSRNLLGMPQDKKIILFVAFDYTVIRKGLPFLTKALEKLPNENFILCGVGNKPIQLKSSLPFYSLGTISDERLMSVAYSAADVFVIPSLEDNLPNTVLESLACGTPVVGFNVGGIPDMVKSGFNGLLSNEISADALKSTIELFFNTPHQFDRQKISEDVVKRFSPKLQAQKYSNLFEKVM